MSRKIISRNLDQWLILVIWLFVSIILPIKASAEFQDRCWLKDSCEGENGIWGGKGGEFKAKYGDRYPGLEALSAQCDTIGTKETALCFINDPAVVLQVGIPGVSEMFCNNYVLGQEPKTCVTDSDCPNNGQCRPGIRNGFPGYLKGFFNFFIPAIAVMSTVMIMWGGFKRIAAAGSSETVKGANDTILGAVSGLILALISYSLLNLINPNLVLNSMSPIEKVKPDTFGFCPKSTENSILYTSGWLAYECRGTSGQASTWCVEDKDCAAQDKCVVEQTMRNKVPNDFDTCGLKLVLNGKDCIGSECFGNKGCFPYEKNGITRYGCSPAQMSGNLSGLEIDNIDLMYVCNNNTENRALDCSVAEPNKSVQSEISSNDLKYYAMDRCWVGKNGNNNVPLSAASCQNAGGLKGLALVVEVVGDGANDWYAINSKTCGTDVKKITDTDEDDDPKAWVEDKMDWSLVPKDELFQPFDSNGDLIPIHCDLNIKRENFPDR